jgi:three-Cys-motif partner protein
MRMIDATSSVTTIRYADSAACPDLRHWQATSGRATFAVMSPDEFFDARREWSAWKHQILEKYLRVWCSKLGSTSKALVFVDGCAGEGKYGDGSIGSPLIAARMNDLPSFAGKMRLLVVAFEKEPETAAKLRVALSPWTSRRPPVAQVFEESFEQGIATAAPQLKDVPTLYFLDPYSMASLTPEALAPLLAGTHNKKELLVRIDPVEFARWLGQLKGADRNARGKKLAIAFERRLQTSGFDPEDIRGMAQEELVQGEAPARLLAGFLELFSSFVYAQLIPIRPSFGAAPKYFMLFCTDSPHGAALMNDVVGTTEDEIWDESLAREEEASGQGSLFNPGRPIRATRSQAIREILEYLRARKGPVAWIEIRAALAQAFGSDLRDKEHRAALQELHRRGAVKWSGAKLGNNTNVELIAGND